MKLRPSIPAFPSGSAESPDLELNLAALRERALERLFGFMTPPDRTAVRSSAKRLWALLRELGARDGGTVLVAYGGGKDSSYTLAYVRAMQLLLAQWHGQPFTLRAVTNRHAGMPYAVMQNIDRAYRALCMPGDPACELLIVDGNAVLPFLVDAPRSAQVVARNRADILMTGHRTHAEARPTFCNACNLSMANAFGVAAAYGGGVDVIITGDSAEEQRAYAVWINKLARRVHGDDDHGHQRANGFPRVLGALDDVAQAYFKDVHGGPGADGARTADAEHGVACDVPAGLRFFSIFGETAYDAGSHWALLTEHLGFVFDELAFSFTESDCANPALMAHLRGLKCQYVFGREYREGLAEYAGFALRLMRRKAFPQPLVDMMAARYSAADAPVVLRERVNEFAREAYGFGEQQLICMVHAPFTARGEGLRRYLESQAPDLAGHEPAIHTLLDAPVGGSADLAARLEELSGLGIDRLRILYRSELLPPLMQTILDGDPHKERIRTRHAPDGPQLTETLSGR